jgi:hypothetical protein
MAQTLTARTTGGIQVTETLTTNFGSTVSDYTLPLSISYVSGNSANSLAINASFIHGTNTVTLATGANATYTLTSLTDDAGRSVTMAGGVRMLVLYVTSRSAGDYLTVGAAGTNPWTSPFSGTTPALKVYDLLVLGVGSTDKYTVAAGSNEQLKITNSGSNSITFKVGILGCAS